MNEWKQKRRQFRSNTGGQCCEKLRISGTTNKDEFYQEMMGDYAIYQDYPKLDFTSYEAVKQTFPVYRHIMHADSEEHNPKNAFLYFYYNTEPRIEEKECPEGCWILSGECSSSSKNCMSLAIRKFLHALVLWFLPRSNVTTWPCSVIISCCISV